MIDHDRLFKELIATFLSDFIALFFPDIIAYLEPNSLLLLDKEIFTDVTSGERYQSDLVIQAQFRGRRAFFIIHIEHQSQTEADFEQRMFRYFAFLHFRHALPVYPIVVYSFDAPQRPELTSYRVDFPNFLVNQFNYRVIQLNRLQWRDFIEGQNAIACALMSKMQMASEERPMVKLECLRMLYNLQLNPAKVAIISGFIDIYLKLNPEEEAAFQTELARIRPVEQEGIMEIVTSWMERGIEQGIKLGELTIVMRLLARRVGSLPPELDERIRQLSLGQIEELGEALLDFSNRADLEAWLRVHSS